MSGQGQHKVLFPPRKDKSSLMNLGSFADNGVFLIKEEESDG